MEIISVHLTKAQLKKFHDEKPFHMTHAQLLKKTGNLVEVRMLQKHAKQLIKAIKNGNGFAFNHETVQGGKINFTKLYKKGKKIVEKVKNNKIVKEILNNPTVKAEVNKFKKKALHQLVDMADAHLDRYENVDGRKQQKYINLAHDYIDANKEGKANIKEHAWDNAVNDIADYVDSKFGGEGLKKGKFKKGSDEAKNRMAMVRAHKKVKGGKLNIGKALKNFGRSPVGKVLKSAGKMALQSAVSTGASALGTALTGNPIAGRVLGTAIANPINNQISGLGLKYSHVPRDNTDLILKDFKSYHGDIHDWKVNGGSFIPY